MKKLFSLAFLSAIVFLSGCVSFRTSGEVQGGRRALLTGKPEVAVGHFQRAAELNPQYVYNFSPLQQGIWTYLGRAYYHSGKLSEARKALERARSQDKDDHLARLYLGLILGRNGNRETGLKEIQGSMKALYDWLEYITYYTTDGEFWDPMREIRSELQTDLAMISGKEIDWKKLIASGEWVGMTLEEEIDRARIDERKELLMEGDDDGDSQP